ncbi:MAG TPA: hypothetical protein VKI62_04850 [Bacteroidota bacterium]|nr:hypothetical protein [Bacteroidota bacterium]
MKPQNLAVLFGSLFALAVVFFGASVNGQKDPGPNVQTSAPMKSLDKQIEQKIPDPPVPHKGIIEVSEKDSTEFVNNQGDQEAKYTDDHIQQTGKENLR